ncbi:phosphate ABC transporter substrate-binding protein, partial [Candidatus Bathyarchaeota archaeon]|nr:phosphate ABC transporter substrate-binding protein [Candidatus Bathyarchaeota archaeon]
VQGGGSGVGYSNVIDGVVDIGMASRDPKKTEIDNAKSKGVDLWLHPIALDAVCVVVHPSVANSSYPLSLTLQEVGKIFAGIYTYWDEVKSGLPHEEIFVVVREPGSGTRGTFEEYTMHPWKYDVTARASVQPSNPAVKHMIETTPYSIGYVGFGFISENMHVVALAKEDGKPYFYPTIDSIVKGEYPISRYLYLVTNGQPKSGSLTDRFIDFVRSEEGQQIVEDCGFLKLPYVYPAP